MPLVWPICEALNIQNVPWLGFAAQLFLVDLCIIHNDNKGASWNELQEHFCSLFLPLFYMAVSRPCLMKDRRSKSHMHVGIINQGYEPVSPSKYRLRTHRFIKQMLVNQDCNLPDYVLVLYAHRLAV